MHSPKQGAIQRALRGHVAFRFLALLTGFGFQILVAKILPPYQYASYAVLLAALLVAERLFSFGMDRTALRFVPDLVARRDQAGLWFLARRYGLLRSVGLIVFITALTASVALGLQITPAAIAPSTSVAFGAWFVAFTLLKDADAIAQSLIAHHWAALVAAGEVLGRLCTLGLIFLSTGSVSIDTVVFVYALTSWIATIALFCIVWVVARTRGMETAVPISPKSGSAAIVQREAPAFGIAAYASTLSYLVSSPGVIRIVARTGLGINELAAYAFVQGFSISLASGLPGQLVLRSLESVAAKMKDRGEGHRIIPILSLLFKIELISILSILVAILLAGADLLRLVSRPEYALYWYIWPLLMVGLLFQTVYSVLEIIGSVNLRYGIFLRLWPLSFAAVLMLYLTVGQWGLMAVLLVPLAEIVIRVVILNIALRRYAVWSAFDPMRSLRLVGAAGFVLLCSLCVLIWYAPTFEQHRLILAFGGVLCFLSATLIVRPLTQSECEVILRFIPSSGTFLKHIVRRLSST